MKDLAGSRKLFSVREEVKGTQASNLAPFMTRYFREFDHLTKRLLKSSKNPSKSTKED